MPCIQVTVSSPEVEQPPEEEPPEEEQPPDDGEQQEPPEEGAGLSNMQKLIAGAAVVGAGVFVASRKKDNGR